MDDSILEKKIRAALEKKSEEARVDALTSRRIRANVYKRIEEERNMKHRNWKKAVVAAAAICVFGTITAVALKKPAYISSHSNLNEIVKDYETAKNMMHGFDASVKIVEEFSNGYKFKEAVPKYEATHDEEHDTLEQGTSMSFTYEKKGMEEVVLSGDRLTVPSSNPDAVLALGDGTELRYNRLTNKFVPPDYTPTEEELKLQEEGKLNIGYGSDQVEEKISVNVTWAQDGVTYSLFSFNGSLTAEEMFQMAKEVAES